jgi:hypothetical protein
VGRKYKILGSVGSSKQAVMQAECIDITRLHHQLILRKPFGKQEFEKLSAWSGAESYLN